MQKFEKKETRIEKQRSKEISSGSKRKASKN
jgi:hypothetical protein